MWLAFVRQPGSDSLKARHPQKSLKCLHMHRRLIALLCYSKASAGKNTMLNLLPVIVIRSLNEEVAQNKSKILKFVVNSRRFIYTFKGEVTVKQLFVLTLAASSAELDLFERDEIQLRTECMWKDGTQNYPLIFNASNLFRTFFSVKIPERKNLSTVTNNFTTFWSVEVTSV